MIRGTSSSIPHLMWKFSHTSCDSGDDEIYVVHGSVLGLSYFYTLNLTNQTILIVHTSSLTDIGVGLMIEPEG